MTIDRSSNTTIGFKTVQGVIANPFGDPFIIDVHGNKHEFDIDSNNRTWMYDGCGNKIPKTP